MKLVCPSCGALASAEAWGNDANVREAVALVAGFPAGIASNVLAYLSLFRSGGGRGLSWPKAVRLTRELKALVEKSYVQRDRDPARRNDPKFWAEGLRTITDRPPARLPLN